MESSTWEFDVDTGYCWFNSKILSRTKGLKDNRHLPLLQTLRYIHPDDIKITFACLRRYLKRGETNFRQDLRILRDNEYVWSEVIAKITLDDEGRLEKMAGIIIDIPERKKKEEELYRQATFDPLTGLPNRGSFDRRFVQIIHENREEGRPFSLLFLDIDHFKKINDTWGHDIGDQALKHVSQILKDALRECDFAARIGGEEFAVLLRCEEAERSGIVAERIRCSIEAAPFILSDMTVPLTVSIGIFNSSKESDDLGCKAILKRADKALYEAKSAGRNRVVAAPFPVRDIIRA
jgi:diguanylate cyclase (GGDEF)-like protein